MRGITAAMYESFFGFKDTPFRLSADEKFRYAHNNYLRASAYLAYALQQSEGFVMITGQPGSGKTTLVRDVISEIDNSKFNALNLVTSQLQAEELLRKVALEYGLPAESYNKATLLTSISKHLSDLYDRGQRSILFLDEAQNLSANGLEELRLLSNLQKGNCSLLQIVLIGHDELRELVLNPKMEHIQQRLIATCQIKPMSAEQSREYIIHRMGIVGWQQDPQLADEVYGLVHQAAQGVPRKINHLMSRLLLFASLEEKHSLTDEDVLVILEELVDERRITLAENESFTDFAERYRIEKQQHSMEQQAAVQKAVVHDIFENRPLQEQYFNEDEADKRQELIASTNQITTNLLSAIDDAGQNIEEAWDLPDSDWGSWESDLSVKRPLQTPDLELSHASLFENSEFEEESADESATDNELSVEFPSADEIWNSDLDRNALDSLISEQQKQRNISTSQVEQTPKHQNSKRMDDEHRWGGVWWMSSGRSDSSSAATNNSQIEKNSNAVIQSSLPSDKVVNRISVEENLSMPSMWVDACPDVAIAGVSTQQFAKPPQRKLGRFIFRLVSWLGIILLMALFYGLFAKQINQSLSDLQERIAGVEAVDQQSAKVLENEALVGAQPDDSNQQTIQSVTEESGGDPAQQGADEPSNLQQSDISHYPQDLSGEVSETIELATRYAVYFEFNKASIPTEYIALLKAVQYKMLTEESTFLRIIGYADTQGDKQYNYQLSLKRADEVKQYFIKRGISGSRLHVAAVGTAEDEIEVLTLSQSAKRRRVEMILFPN
ncbi:MAG: AAA family ATPase [Candidatus Thiodiazotropha lotti]|uniref:AAA family ATPase n=1 Tax=Candidatus Thiodiazotropha lotti TaxID=2792787 RepID=A0A9E4K4Z0_9GAMM|nr:AAA family ATPase [Candidatus Thiodiazotropha lotti]MCG7939771.1 AAA family ATPase [Candidatus Thiodiazotropha lotti]MCG8005155.1 AAA family ATPase [Candidatus Thiodiazotropha lotti]MCG8007010.1 AAA family ATPase [Candidatus Thiodiazotropha lotti]MCW4188783.1 AAA family ATPase [Candidatus Thiodiazotropha lotti]